MWMFYKIIGSLQKIFILRYRCTSSVKRPIADKGPQTTEKLSNLAILALTYSTHYTTLCRPIGMNYSFKNKKIFRNRTSLQKVRRFPRETFYFIIMWSTYHRHMSLYEALKECNESVLVYCINEFPKMWHMGLKLNNWSWVVNISKTRKSFNRLCPLEICTPGAPTL
jgi:hypothetical protein